MALSDKDRKAIEKQLGRVPRGVEKVTNYTKDGEPLVILTNPIIVDKRRTTNDEQFEPFPTLYYLTYPPKVEAVSRLEDRSYIKKYEQKIQNNSDFRVDFLKAQREYIKERIVSAGKEIDKLSPKKREVIEKTGIGGVKDLTKIKCLHSHYAHYLAKGNNPVGKMVEEELRMIKPPPTLPLKGGGI